MWHYKPRWIQYGGMLLDTMFIVSYLGFVRDHPIRKCTLTFILALHVFYWMITYEIVLLKTKRHWKLKGRQVKKEVGKYAFQTDIIFFTVRQEKSCYKHKYPHFLVKISSDIVVKISIINVIDKTYKVIHSKVIRWASPYDAGATAAFWKSKE